MTAHARPDALAVSLADVVRFPPGWLTIHGAYGWSHGDFIEALRHARELGDEFGLPVRIVS